MKVRCECNVLEGALNKKNALVRDLRAFSEYCENFCSTRSDNNISSPAPPPLSSSVYEPKQLSLSVLELLTFLAASPSPV